MNPSEITRFGKIAIVGIGLIGGSLARDVKRLGIANQIIGYDNNLIHQQEIRSLDLVDYLGTTPDEKLLEADLILLSVPVKAVEKIVRQILPYLSPTAVITDTGSVKSPLLKLMSAPEFERISFVGGHPIAGSEHYGPSAAQEKLFLGKRLFLTMNKNTDNIAVEKVSRLWQSLGAEVTKIDADIHDKMFASVSHLPHLLAYTTINAITNSETPNALSYSGAGLKDFSRIASSSPEMWADIFLENSTNLKYQINAFKKSLSTLEEAINENDKQKLVELLSQAKRERDNWIT